MIRHARGLMGVEMDDAHAVREAGTGLRGPEVARQADCDDCASRAADLSAELYAREERTRRRESLEELLSRDRDS